MKKIVDHGLRYYTYILVRVFDRVVNYHTKKNLIKFKNNF